MKTQSKILLIVAAAIVLVVLFARRRTPGPAVEPEPLEEHPATVAYDDGLDLDAYLERVGVADPETGFDMEAHVEALEQVGGAHHARLAEAAESAETLQAYEQAERRGTPERAALADAIDARQEEITTQRAAQRVAFETDAEWKRISSEGDAANDQLRVQRQAVRDRFHTMHDADDEDAVREAMRVDMDRLRELAQKAEELRQKVEKRERYLTETLPEARDAAQAVAALQDEIQEKESAHRATFADDEAWRTLNAEYEAADARRDLARQRLQAVIRARMLAEHALRRQETGVSLDDVLDIEEQP